MQLPCTAWVVGFWSQTTDGQPSPAQTAANANCKLHASQYIIQGGSNMTGTYLCVNKPHCAAAV